MSAGPGAPVVAPDDVDAYIAFARRIIDDHDYRTRLVGAGQTHISRFSLQNFAGGLRASYDMALQCHGL